MADSTVLYSRAYQANALVRAPLKLNHVEARIFALSLSCIHQDQTELPGIAIPLSRVLTQKKGGSVYETIRDACKSLMSKVVSLESKTGNKKRFTAYSIISYIDIDEGSGFLTGNFAPEIKPFLLQLAERYTHVEIETLLMLKSAHAHRLYWLLKSWDDVGQWEVSFEELRRQMLGDANDSTYTLFYDFKRYVLEPSLRELRIVNWHVTYKPMKEGKKVVGLHFTIPRPAESTGEKTTLLSMGENAKARLARPEQEQMTLALSAELPTLQQRIITRLEKLRISEKQISQVLAYVGDDEKRITKLMKVSYPLLRDHESGTRVLDNLGGAAINVLKAEFPGLYPMLK